MTMTSYLDHVTAITAETCDDASERAHLNLAAASAGAVLLAGLKDAFDRGGFGAMVAQFDLDVAATSSALFGYGMAPDVTPFSKTVVGRA